MPTDNTTSTADVEARYETPSAELTPDEAHAGLDAMRAAKRLRREVRLFWSGARLVVVEMKQTNKHTV